MRFVIVTGMSGAGKSSVLKMLEDLGYFCVDNLPVHFIPKMTKLMVDEQETVDKMGLGIDVRNLQGLSDLDNILDKMKQEGYPYEVLFLEADDSVLVKRYKETRRNHPLALQGRAGTCWKKHRRFWIFHCLLWDHHCCRDDGGDADLYQSGKKSRTG